MIVVLTATEDEYRSVRVLASGLRTHATAAGTLFELGTIGGRDVALALVGKGNNSAAVLTERAITEFSPAAVFFVGIAGALSSQLQHGDVVVATKVYAYHGGREDASGFAARPRAWEAPHHLEQLARHVARAGEWRVHFEPVAAGELVLDGGAETLARLRSIYNDAVAVEMESAGVAGAGWLNHATPTFTVRAIGTAVPAAEFAAAVIAELPASPMRSDGSVYKNVASGTSGFVLQVGVVHGNVNVDRVPRDEDEEKC